MIVAHHLARVGRNDKWIIGGAPEYQVYSQLSPRCGPTLRGELRLPHLIYWQASGTSRFNVTTANWPSLPVAHCHCGKLYHSYSPV